MMNYSSLRYLIDNALDFSDASKHIEDEIARLNLDSNSWDEVPNLAGRKHHDTWASMKNVSHSNLGISLELMFKLILYVEDTEYRNEHSLIYLYDLLSVSRQNELNDRFDSLRRKSKGIKNITFMNEIRYSKSRDLTPSRHKLVGPPGAAPATQENRRRDSLRDFLKYLDEVARLFERRYQWEYIEKGYRRHYINDLTLFIDLIQDTLSSIDNEIRLSQD